MSVRDLPTPRDMADPIRFDYDSMLRARLGERGIEESELAHAAAAFPAKHAAIEARRAAGELGFFRLPDARAEVERVRRYADGPGQAFDTVVVLGIGGSALGASALLQALKAPFWNELDDDGRDFFPRLYVLDNVDPTTIGPLLDRLPLGRTLFNVVSKSGTTAETMAQFLVIRDRVVREVGPDGYRGQLVFTTDPEQGVLRRIAREEEIAAVAVPPDVGGRFSVLSPVGLLPAALVGIDVDALLDGAADAVAAWTRAGRELRQNPAALYAALQHVAHELHGASVHVMMAYGDRLAGIADWFRQLWAESLGKRLDRQGREVFRGPTPVKAVGATDQHSQVQLYMEGPFDKTITLLGVAGFDEDVAIPEGQYSEVDALAYLGGSTLGTLLQAERTATAGALSRAGRMNMTLELARVDARTVGELLMMLQIATVYAGELYDVDPLDQPGVELGKQLTYGLMGRPGFEPSET
ncbi:MAG: glucose-6-phosphate isomerase [Longimicrobiales bacterium]